MKTKLTNDPYPNERELLRLLLILLSPLERAGSHRGNFPPEMLPLAEHRALPLSLLPTLDVVLGFGILEDSLGGSRAVVR